jgi:hypothetical protein
MHSTDFFSDLDATKTAEVAESRTLEVGIDAGVQTFPAPDTDETANRLLIFTGTAICEIPADGDGDLSRGVVRVRLGFPLHKSIHLVGSATVAALASLHGNDDEDAVFAVDAATTVAGPTDNGTLDAKGLPEDDLYVIMDAATMGADSLLGRIAYQANVLVRDLEPELESLLVKPDGSNVPFAPEAEIPLGGKWDYQVNLTGPVVDGTFLILIQSSDPSAAPVAPATQLLTNQTSGAFLGGVGMVPANVRVTASAKGISKTALVRIISTR